MIFCTFFVPKFQEFEQNIKNIGIYDRRRKYTCEKLSLFFENRLKIVFKRRDQEK